MYKAPDFIKVSAKAKDIFAAYICNGDYNSGALYSGDTSCEVTDEAGTLVYGLSGTWQCYSTLNP